MLSEFNDENTSLPNRSDIQSNRELIKHNINEEIIWNQLIVKAVAVFTLPKSFLEKKILFFIVGRDDSIACSHAMPNGVAGVSN